MMEEIIKLLRNRTIAEFSGIQDLILSDFSTLC